MKTTRKLLSLSLALLFFFETTVFYPVRAIAAQSPRLAVQSAEPSPYHWRTPEEIVEAVMAELEAMEAAELASASAVLPAAPSVATPATVAAATQPPPPIPGATTRESVSSTEEEGDKRSNAPSVSADGRYVAFESEARNLVSDDNNKKKNVFVRDRAFGTTTRVSVASDGTEANGESGEPAVSADGRYVVFESKASNLSPADTNKRWDIFLHDRQNRETIPVTHGDDDSHAPAISADGRYIAFESDAEELVVGDTGHRRDIFVYERDTGEMSLVSVSSGGAQADRDANNVSISGDGRYVGFDSKASNLVVGDSNNQEDVFVHDRETGETMRVSVSSSGEEGDHRSEAPSISGAGRFVAFQSKSRNLVPGLAQGGSADDDSSDDDASSDDDSSDDDSSDDDSSDDDGGRQDHIYVHDRDTGETKLVSQSTDGVPGDKKSSEASISATGRFVAFASKARNLVPDDTNHKEDVFVRDLAREITIRVSVGHAGEGDKESGRPAISGNGSLVAYESKARNLVPDDTNRKDDVFATEVERNRSPLAVDDDASTLQNTSVDIAVLSNDDDPDGDTLTVESVESMSGASLEILDNGSVRYLPPVDFVGVDTFTYTIDDGHGAAASATVRVEVNPINQPPVVDAGPDQNVVLPDSERLQGSVVDDGLPNNTLLIEWTKLSGLDGATIVSPTMAVTDVTFTQAGVYEFQLEASDSEFTVTDTVMVTVEEPMMVTVSVGDLTVVEGSGGLTEVMVPVTLSSASNQAVAVDFLTFDGTALTSCDYVTQFGTLSFAVGETSKEIRVPVVGDLAIEPDENLMVRLGNVVGAEMGDDEGMVIIEDDDAANQGPSPAGNRTPLNGATGLDPNPTLSWTGSDPDGDPLDFDVYFGTAFGTDGQAWVEQCSGDAWTGTTRVRSHRARRGERPAHPFRWCCFWWKRGRRLGSGEREWRPGHSELAIPKPGTRPDGEPAGRRRL